jgi:hypothetical protein
LTLALLATFRPLWYWSNAWIGSEQVDPSLPAGIFDGTQYVDWWGVLGPDLAQRFHPVTSVLVAWVPVAVVLASAVVPLVVRSWRSAFAPAVVVAVTMWGAQVASWAALYRDNTDAWHLEPGAYVLVAGLVISVAGALWDRRRAVASR